MILMFFGLWLTLIATYVSARIFFRPIQYVKIQG